MATAGSTLTGNSTIHHVTLLRENLLQTVTFCLLFSLVGMSDASLGAALPGLTCLARTSERRITVLLLFHEMAVMLVTLIIGCINRGNAFKTDSPRARLCSNLLLASVAALMPVCFILVPSCRSLSSLALAFTAMGLLEGCLEFCCNLRMLALYRRQAGPFLQAMFFCQSLGAFVAPLIIGAFLADTAPQEWRNCTRPDEAVSLRPDSFAVNDHVVVYEVDDALESLLARRVRNPFFVIAGCQVPIALLMLALTYKEAVFEEEVLQGPQILTNADDDDSPSLAGSGADSIPPSSAHCWLLLLLASVCAFTLDGILGSYSSLIFAFSMRSVTPTGWQDRGSAAYLPATFWGFTLLGRLTGIFLSVKLSSAAVLLIDAIGLLVFAVVFILGQGSIVLLFIATVGTGFCVSRCMPALLALSEQFLRVTKDAALCLVTSAAFGEAVMPVVMAAAIHRIGNRAYPMGHCLLVIGSGALSCLYIGVGSRVSSSSRPTPAPPQGAELLALDAKKRPTPPTLSCETVGAAATAEDAAATAKTPLSQEDCRTAVADYGSQARQ